MFHALLLVTAIAAQTHAWRVAHERAVLAEFAELLAIPNVASDAPNIARNAAAIRAMFDKRGLATRFLTLEGAPPIVVADLKVPGRRGRSPTTRTTTGSRSMRRSGSRHRG